jgi:hypothetical protein
MNNTDYIILGAGVVAGFIILKTVKGGGSSGLNENLPLGAPMQGAEILELQRLINSGKNPPLVNGTGFFDNATEDYFDRSATNYILANLGIRNPAIDSWISDRKITLKLYKDNKSKFI